MKTFSNVNPKSVPDAVKLLGQPGKSTAIVGGGSDLLGMVKERLVQPDVLVNLKAIPSLDKIEERGGQIHIGGLATLTSVSEHPAIRARYKALADAAGSVGTPQIRNAGTIAGNVCQRPWCWYFRNGFPCFKNGGKTCFSVVGENEFHAIFGGGPSFIVHPSDTAPALVALEAKFRIGGPSGERTVAAADFFASPSKDPARENILAHDEVLVEIQLPSASRNLRSAYHKELDRESWTHAIVSAAVALEMNRDVCKRASVVLGGVAPIPWRLPKVEAMLAGKRITAELAAQAGEASVEGARPLAKNGYKIPLTRTIVKRTIAAVASA
ncbi:MAG TPA: xanthine dehydrogenase family protein subunit M [Bryobacteraceae bacterium]|jgi:xanthine dehydrogenase YagS FAD-binding subunit